MQTETAQEKKPQKKELTLEELYKKLLKAKERNPLRLSPADKEFMEEYETEQETIRKREALRHNLISGADAFGRKQLKSIRRGVTDEVGKFGKQESDELKILKRGYDVKQAAAEKLFKSEIKKLNEEYDSDKKILRREWESGIDAVRAKYKHRYDDASKAIEEKCKAVTDTVAEFIEAVRGLDDAGLRELQDAKVLKLIGEDGEKHTIKVPA